MIVWYYDLYLDKSVIKMLLLTWHSLIGLFIQKKGSKENGEVLFLAVEGWAYSYQSITFLENISGKQYIKDSLNATSYISSLPLLRINPCAKFWIKWKYLCHFTEFWFTCSKRRVSRMGKMDDPILKSQDKDSFLGREVKLKDNSTSSFCEIPPKLHFFICRMWKRVIN